MSFTNPQFTIQRRKVEQPPGEAGLWEKHEPKFNKVWGVSPPTPELLDLLNLPAGVRANPVPDVMAAADLAKNPSPPKTLDIDLMSGVKLLTWDSAAPLIRIPGDPFTGRPRGRRIRGQKELVFFMFRTKRNRSPFNKPVYPAPTLRIPRGAIFHADSLGKGPPPHTIHWHGIEPTPMNDGVGHCSMEIGRYVYQFQPNAIGTYLYHCHRSTIQHFEFGLLGLLIIDPPDAFFASIEQEDQRTGRVTLNTIPIGAGRDGLRRIAANLVTPIEDFTELFPGFIEGDPIDGVNVPDPEGQFATDPHAFTVPYDVEVFWVLDDRDSIWSEFAPDARAFFPREGNKPGINDKWAPGFFNDFRSDYWFVTGVPVVPLDGVKRTGNIGRINPSAPPPIGGSGGLDLGPAGEIPAALNSGVAGTQIAVNARVNQTVLIRILDAAYDVARVTFPVDVVIIGMDGRALGVPPHGRYNNAFRLPAGESVLICSARRFDVLVRVAEPVNDFARVDFLDHEGGDPDPTLRDLPVGILRQTALIPFVFS